MTQKLTKSTITVCFALSFLALLESATNTVAMEPLPPTQSTLNHGNLSTEFQKDLTKLGHDLLDQIYSEESMNLSKATFYQDIAQKHGDEFYKNQYSWYADYAPTNIARWYWSSTDDSYITTRKNQMTGIVAISWALADIAAKQNDSFERGSFTIIDQDHKLYHFLLDYVKLTTGYKDPQTLPYVLTSCNFAYRRDPILHGSSHHNGRCPQSQFGIDVRFAPTEGVLKLLPYNSTHLLFALLDVDDQQDPLLFIKWEDLGLGSIGATAIHSLGFHGSQAHVASDARREKDILPKIQDSFNELKKIVDIEGDHKTIRSMILKADELAEQAKISIQKYNKTNETLLNIPLVGENTIDSLDQKIKRNVLMIKEQEAIQNAAKSFIELIEGIYPNKNNHVRCGNEVILELPIQR